MAPVTGDAAAYDYCTDSRYLRMQVCSARPLVILGHTGRKSICTVRARRNPACFYRVSDAGKMPAVQHVASPNLSHRRLIGVYLR